MPKPSSNINFGYTLIEMLIAITIIAIIFGVGYSNYRDFSRRQSLESFSQKVKGDLSLAREKSKTGEKPDNPFCTGSNTLNGYSVTFRVDGYSISAMCSGGTVSNLVSVDSPDNITITLPSTNPILFKVLNTGTNLTESNTITLTLENMNINSEIIIFKSGDIK